MGFLAMKEHSHHMHEPSSPKNRIDPSCTRVYPTPMKVSAQYAQEHFADILAAIDTGEEVELARPRQPSVRLAGSPK